MVCNEQMAASFVIRLISAGLCLVAGLLAITIALLTISFQSVQQRTGHSEEPSH